jgi:hypothetical protein
METFSLDFVVPVITIRTKNLSQPRLKDSFSTSVDHIRDVLRNKRTEPSYHEISTNNMAYGHDDLYVLVRSSLRLRLSAETCHHACAQSCSIRLPHADDSRTTPDHVHGLRQITGNLDQLKVD